MPMTLEQARSVSSVSEVQFANVLYYFIKMYGDSVYYGHEKMKKALDTLEGMLSHYRYTIDYIYQDENNKWYTYDEIKEKRLKEYKDALTKLPKRDYEKKSQELEYSFLKEKFKLLMLLVGKAQLMPALDVEEEQL